MRKYGGRLADALAAQKGFYGGLWFRIQSCRYPFQRLPAPSKLDSDVPDPHPWFGVAIDEERRLAVVRKALIFGNHKGASMKLDLLLQLMSKDVHLGYCLPLPLTKAKKIPGILITPMNIQQQNTIDKFGRIIPKDRQTHDQSFKWSSGTSVNSRVKTEELFPCLFGACIKQIVNWAITSRRLFPDVPILASKIDFKSAF
jgi:hypothetical protein